MKIENQWQTILFGVLGLYLIKKLFDKKEPEIDSSTSPEQIKEDTEKSDVYQNHIDAGVYRSYSWDTYKSIADKLFTAMDGAGTDTNQVINLLTNYVQNDLDWICIYNSFGSRTPSGWFGSAGNLRTWLKGDLSTSDIQEINDTWKEKGKITKRI